MDFKNLEFYSNVLQWPLIPCSAKDKKPLTAHGFKDATDGLSACGDNHALFVLASLRVMIPMRATCTTALLRASVCS